MARRSVAAYVACTQIRHWLRCDRDFTLQIPCRIKTPTGSFLTSNDNEERNTYSSVDESFALYDLLRLNDIHKHTKKPNN
jgi:hypothetical protein